MVRSPSEMKCIKCIGCRRWGPIERLDRRERRRPAFDDQPITLWKRHMQVLPMNRQELRTTAFPAANSNLSARETWEAPG